MNPPLSSMQVAINTRTLRIGHQTYQLQTLARVQIIKRPKPADAEKGNIGLAILAAVAVLAISGAVAGGAQSGAVCSLGLPLAIGAAIFVYLKTKKQYVQLYELMLETNGYPATALASPDRTELEKLSAAIVDAIENPPASEFFVQMNKVILGDQINQFGNQNIGRMGGVT